MIWTLSQINSGLVNDFGLFLDIIGAIFLSKSIIFKGLKQVHKETSSYYDGNPFIFYSYLNQIIEAFAGLVFLVFGFLLQFASNHASSGPNNHIGLTIAVSVLLGVIVETGLRLVGKNWARKKSAKRYGRNWLEGIKNKEKDKSNLRKEFLANFYGDAVEFKKRNEETDENYSKRFKKFLEENLD